MHLRNCAELAGAPTDFKEDALEDMDFYLKWGELMEEMGVQGAIFIPPSA